MAQLRSRRFAHPDPRVQMRREMDEQAQIDFWQAQQRKMARRQPRKPPGMGFPIPRPIMPPPGMDPRAPGGFQPFNPFAPQAQAGAAPMGFGGMQAPQQPVLGGFQSFARQRVPLTQGGFF